MALIDNAFKGIADLDLWFKVQSNDLLTLSDVPQIIPYRWTYFRDNWELIKSKYIAALATYQFPSILNDQITQFSAYIISQRSVKAAINPFADAQIPKRFFAIFDNSLISAIPVSQVEQSIITATTTRIQQFSKTDFLNIRSGIVAARDQLADTIGGTDPDYNRIMNRSPVPASVDPTIVDINNMQVMMGSIKACDFILANIYSLPTTTVDPFALAKQNANNPGMSIGQYSSGNLVRLNYGETLQELAARTLGNPDKWIDIAIANGLKPPYIDEVGTNLPLIANGRVNQINISGTDAQGNSNIDKLFINQVIFLQSNTQKFPDQRTIIDIQSVPISGEIVLQLSGDATLDMYTTADSAHMLVYKPNTTNSGFYILIPSNSQVDDATSKNDIPWFLATKGEDERRAKVDLLLDANNDLVFGSTGDLNLNYGVSNALQALKLKFTTEQGSLAKHTGYGLPSVQGLKNTNSSQVKAVLTNAIRTQIENDSRFSELDTLDVQSITNSAGTGFQVRLVVRLAGSGTNIPIAFQINPN